MIQLAQKPQKVVTVKIARKVWTIEVYTNRYGNKFVKAKQETVYDTIFEVQLYRMPDDGMVFAYEVNHHPLDNEVLSALRSEMIKVRDGFYKEERNNDDTYSQFDKNRAKHKSSTETERHHSCRDSERIWI